MILKSVQIKYFKHILDSTKVAIQPDITCLVGKNESGKTAFLEALRRLKPAQGGVDFKINEHYPAWLEKRHRREGRDIENMSPPISCCFEFEEKDINTIEKIFGEGVLTSKTFTLSRLYNNRYRHDYGVNEEKAVKNCLAELDLPSSVSDAVANSKTFDALQATVKKLVSESGEDQQAAASCASIKEKISQLLPEQVSFSTRMWNLIFNLVPRFFFYSDYSRLPGRVRIKDLLEANSDNLDENEQTALSLLELAGTEEEYLLNPDYETRKRELENVANAITQEVLTYWTTNSDLRVEIDTSKEREKLEDGTEREYVEMHVRMRDDRHMLSLPFDGRSSGFRWFFSFLAAFSRYEHGAPVVILLDEPALGLHARAQKDFLRFIEERLAKCCQVIYTTHSPFMIQSDDNLERARLVEDKGQDVGSVTTSDVLTTDQDTLFPLQAALGYDIAQHLFISKDNLVVEGPSDFIFMSTISSHLKTLDREGLNDNWSIMPLGGADVIPAFVALLGNHLDVTVVVDARKEGHQKLTHLAEAGFLKGKRIITIGEITKQKTSDIEDLFTPGDYIKLYNAAFGKKIKISDLQGDDSIVKKIARHEDIERFNHDAPADMLLRDKNKWLEKLSSETLDAFEKLFKRINETLRTDS